MLVLTGMGQDCCLPMNYICENYSWILNQKFDFWKQNKMWLRILFSQAMWWKYCQEWYWKIGGGDNCGYGDDDDNDVGSDHHGYDDDFAGVTLSRSWHPIAIYECRNLHFVQSCTHEWPDVLMIRAESENFLHRVSIFAQLWDSVMPAYSTVVVMVLVMFWWCWRRQTVFIGKNSVHNTGNNDGYDYVQ